MEDMEEANIGLADIKEMGYEVGENLFSQIKDKFQNTPDFEAYFAGLKMGFLDNLEDLEEDYNESTQYDKTILESNRWIDNSFESNKED